MTLLKIGTRVKFGSIPGTVVGHGTMQSPGGTTIATYAVRLDEKFRGYLRHSDPPNASYISTMLVCADGVTRI